MEALTAVIGDDRALSLQLLLPQHRSAIETVWRIDAALGDVVARSTDPTLGRIKLAWWREQLQQIDSAAAPAEPRLQAVVAELLPRGISGADLSEIEPGWATLLVEPIDPHLVAERGARLFTMIAALLGQSDARIGDAGSLWALVSVSMRRIPELREAAMVYADRLQGHRFAMGLRGLSLLARFAALDLKRGSPSKREGRVDRLMPALTHIWSGIVIPRS